MQIWKRTSRKRDGDGQVGALAKDEGLGEYIRDCANR